MERWSSRTGFLLAAVGSAVGLGNIWRFPTIVGENGGGAFYLLYLISFMLFALPLMMLEVSIGRRTRCDVVSALGLARRELRASGWLVCIITLSILSYYLVVAGWTLAFLLMYVAGWDITFQQFVSSYWPVASFIAAALITGIVSSSGVRRGIESINSYLMPLVFLILIVMALYSTTLPGFRDGVRFFLTPDPRSLLDGEIWAAAFGQAFFSLGVGQGILLTYGTYLKRDVEIRKASITVALLDILASTLAGFVIFPLVFSFGLEPAAGPELAFVSLPRAFEGMPSGRILGASFFALLFSAALTSSVSLLEVSTAAVTSTKGLSRRRAGLGLTSVVLFLGLPSALSYSPLDLMVYGNRFLDLMDMLAGTFGLLITALLISVAFTWALSRELIPEEVSASRLTYSAARYAVPLVLAIIISWRAIQLI